MTECGFLTGAAGTGKSFTINRRLKEDPRYGLLAATTGIAATNLGNAVTVNSALKYFDTESLKNSYYKGKLLKAIRDIAKQRWKRLIVDEVSMMAGEQLDILVMAFDEYNRYHADEGKELGLMLTGDFLQLPPVKAKWAFESQVWERFEKNTERLEKVWRQDNPLFLEALNRIRKGDGEGAMMLRECGVEFSKTLDFNYAGTTLVAVNDQVDRINDIRMLGVNGKGVKVKSSRWWQEGEKMPSEWKNIPDVMELKEGAYVMVLANEPKSFSYVNGDCGVLEEISQDGLTVRVRLKRTGDVITLGRITRKIFQGEQPEVLKARKDEGLDDTERFWGTPYYDEEEDRYVVGEITYLPVRAAWGTSVHKSQGLTLDLVQLDPTHRFFGSPGMVYVSLSRCRRPEGIRIVGTPEMLRERVSMDEKVKRFA